MGILDRFKRKDKEGGAPIKVEERQVYKAQMGEEGITYAPAGKRVEVRVEAEDQPRPSEDAEERESLKNKIKAKTIRTLDAALDKRNWGSRTVGELPFGSLRDARAYARAMRRRGYTAKVVRLSDGTYKVYVYQKGKGDPLSKMQRGFKIKGLSDTKGLNKTLGNKTLKSLRSLGGQGDGSGRLSALSGGISFPSDIGVGELDLDVDFDSFGLGGEDVGKKKVSRRRKGRR